MTNNCTSSVNTDKANIDITLRFGISSYQDEDGKWIGECPELAGCVSQGDTFGELLWNMQDAIEACIYARIHNSVGEMK